MQTVDDPAADINDGLILSLRDLHHTMRSLYEGKASQKRILIILNECDNSSCFSSPERQENISSCHCLRCFSASSATFLPLSVREMSVVLRSDSFCVRTIQPEPSSLDRISLAEPGWIPKRSVRSLWVIASNSFRIIYKENEDTFRHGHRHGCRDDGGHHGDSNGHGGR